MKRFLSIILCLLILSGCVKDNIENSSSLSSENSSHAVSEVMISDEELAESMLGKLVKGNLALETWHNTQQLDGEKLYLFFSYLFSPNVYVEADVYEDYMAELFGVSFDTLRECRYYIENRLTYNFIGRYIHGNHSFEFMEYHTEGNIISVDYIIYSPLDIPRYRTMTFERKGNSGQYISNIQNTLYSYNPHVEPVSLEKENLLHHASALAEHFTEQLSGTYRLRDMTDGQIMWFVCTLFMFSDYFPETNNGIYHPYNKQMKYNGGNAVYTDSQVQMMVYQLFGRENWHYDDEIYDEEIMRYVQPSELGFGFGPTAYEITAEYISDSRIKVNVPAIYNETDEYIHCTIYFDIINENNCTFLRFSEMMKFI